MKTTLSYIIVTYKWQPIWLLLFWMCPEAKKAFIFSVLCIILNGKQTKAPFCRKHVSDLIDLVTTWTAESEVLSHVWVKCVTDRERERETCFPFFLFLSLCVSGERGRGYESSGTGWENPPLPPGGTPSPLTSPSSPSPTTLWGTSTTHWPLSAMYVDQSMLKVWLFWKAQFTKKKPIFSP